MSLRTTCLTLARLLCWVAGLAFALRAAADLPDLAPIDLTWPGVLTADQPTLFSATITNYGPGTAVQVQFRERLTLCRTNTLADASQIIQSYLIYDGLSRTVSSNTAYTNTRTISLPGNLAAGPYYLILEANLDPGTGQPVIAETTRTNNTLVKAVNIVFADLAPLELSWPGALVPGQTTSFTCTVTNYGPGSAGPIQFSEQLSLSRTNNPADTNQIVQQWKLYSFVTQFVPGGSAYTNGSDRTLSTSIRPGFYYLLLEANRDPSSGTPLFAEATRSNNWLVKPVSIGVTDLALSSMVVTSTPAIANGQAYVLYSVTNTSSNTLNSVWSDRFVFSTTPDLAGALSTNLYNESPVLPPGASYSRARPVHIPPVLPGSNYYIVLDIDSADTVPEENEANNRQVLQTAVTNLLPTISWVAPLNPIQATSCVPTRFTLMAQGQPGSYALTNVLFLDNDTNIIASVPGAAFAVCNPALPPGAHRIKARVFDNFGFTNDSLLSGAISLYWPTNLHHLLANVATNGDFVGCMCAYPGSNYVIEATPKLQPPAPWTPYVTNQAGPNVVAFTNNRASPMLFFRARLAP